LGDSDLNTEGEIFCLLSSFLEEEGRRTVETADTFYCESIHPWVEEHRHRVSFGLQVFPTETRTNPGRYLIAAGHLAEHLDFDAFFVADHPAWGLEGWVHLTTLVAKTERICLDTNVTCIFYRHPVLVARLASDLDHLRGGRLILGLDCGWDANEFAKLGIPFPKTNVKP
jgi:alkanesulfonate monooxygenase SsuD/methylene tetrahydromethanopterin reductase-like flavin-dependent oxidoreductase (luciferase family)